jgi:pimeloyl-ACP methyl ester carboxylesterase
MVKRLLSRTRGRVAHLVDHAFKQTALTPTFLSGRPPAAEQMNHGERIEALSLMEAVYNRPEYLQPGSTFFPAPATIAPREKRIQRFGRDGEVIELSWPSEFEPLWSEAAIRAVTGSSAPQQDFIARIDRRSGLREKYLAVEANRTARAYWFRHRQGPRPTLAIIHGYMGGFLALERRMWPLRALFDGGLDIVFTVLPFHGARRNPSRGLKPPAFPSADPRFTIEGFRQLVLDHRSLFTHLLAQHVPSLGVMGMSLGGYSAGLLATLQPNLTCCVMHIPLASIEAFAHGNGRMVGSDAEQHAQTAALGRAHIPISPLARPPLVAASRCLVTAGRSDLVTGVDHAQRLAHHFGAPLHMFEGGHLLQVGRGDAFNAMLNVLRAAGLLTQSAA